MRHYLLFQKFESVLYLTLPDVVICDLADTTEMKILSKLCKSPGLLLIG
jgi:hypothetical protein